MKPKNGFTKKVSVVAAVGLATSVSLIGCSSADENVESSANSSKIPSVAATQSKPATSPATKVVSPTASQQPESRPSETPKGGESSMPPSFMAEVPKMNVATPEQAIEVLEVALDHNPDLTYVAHLNEYGTFDVTVKSISLASGGGTGTVGTYEVNQDGNYVLKSEILR